jgi:hypothetical protein
LAVEPPGSSRAKHSHNIYVLQNARGVASEHLQWEIKTVQATPIVKDPDRNLLLFADPAEFWRSTEQSVAPAAGVKFQGSSLCSHRRV